MTKNIEIKQVSEREIWVGKNRLFLGEDNIIYVNAVGDLDEKTAGELIKADIKLANMAKGKVHFLNDLNKAGKPSAKARKILLEVTGYDKTGKIAGIGLHPVARVIAQFFIKASKKKNMRFFKTKKEALAWLKE